MKGSAADLANGRSEIENTTAPVSPHGLDETSGM